MCVCLSVQPSALTEHFTEIFPKICVENYISIKILQQQPVL